MRFFFFFPSPNATLGSQTRRMECDGWGDAGLHPHTGLTPPCSRPSLRLPDWEEEKEKEGERPSLLSPPPGARPDPPGSHAPPTLVVCVPPLSPHLAHAIKKQRPPENAAGLAHSGSRMGHRRRTTGPLLPRRVPKSAFPGKKAEPRTAFQCVFSQKNKYKGDFLFFFSSSRHSSLNRERSVRSPTSYKMCWTVNNPV